MSIYYASPTGVPGNAGTLGSPWNLQTAMNHASVAAGDTIIALAGTYKGIYSASLPGSSGSRITIKPEYREAATIDPNQELTLATAITNTTATGNVVFNEIPNIPPGTALVMVDDELIRVTIVAGSASAAIVTRGIESTTAATHAVDAPIFCHQEIVTLNGSGIIFRDFHITDSRTDRVTGAGGSVYVRNLRHIGIDCYATDSLIINNRIHDTGQGIGLWTPATNSYAFGNLCYNNGYVGTDRGHGHGIYTQNNTGTKTVSDNVLFGNFGGFGVHAYTSGANVNNFLFAKNIQANENFLVGGGSSVHASGVVLQENYVFRNDGGNGLNIGYLGWNYDATLTENYVRTSGLPVAVWKFRDLTQTGNTFYKTGTTYTHAFFMDTADTPDGYVSDNNVYKVGSGSVTFYVDGVQDSVAQWQARGLDLSSTFTNGTLPDEIFYKENTYESGRYHVVIFNHSEAATVDIDMAEIDGIPTGGTFEIRNALNYDQVVVAETVYSGQTIEITMGDLEIAQPYGDTDGIVNTEVSPTFAALLVLPFAADDAPGQPTALDVDRISNTVMRATWTLGAGTETGVTLEHNSGSGWTQIALDADTETYDFTPTAGLTYQWRVKASNASGDSLYSDSVTRVATIVYSFGSSPGVEGSD